MTEAHEIADEVLREGADDWVPLDSLIWYARESASNSGSDFKRLAIEALEFLLSEELVLVGDLGESGFEPWATSTTKTIERIVAACESTDWKPSGGLCWLSTTPKGDQRVQGTG
ncbi:hypothetical protein [Actinoallomurus soli]|uniref:hypothetical protein n=1 Tax=Actinoallomurus soli TaxID=2952535 RepID=UPI0020937B4C|nr:hypothetical protein [Actinoallomurus soli]MCO5968918.1 hypothetical protein [Actinoallomurus soli]